MPAQNRLTPEPTAVTNHATPESKLDAATDLPPIERFVVGLKDHGLRLDRWLSEQLRDHSRSEIQRWIKSGQVLINGSTAKTSHRLETEQVVSVELPKPPVDTTLIPEDIPITILYQDKNIVVIAKQAGLVVHPAAGHPSGTLVNAVLHHCPDIEGVGGARRPGLVHRLDKDTSGVIVLAKNDSAHNYLQKQFQERTVYKEYLALAEGVLDPPSGRINAPMGRHPVHRKRQAILPPDPVTGLSAGREAITDYETLEVYETPVRDATNIGRFSLVKVILQTGRTHQIRVHLAWLKHPVVGDTVYGYRRQRIKLDRQFLHAHRLGIRLPGETETRTFVAPLPDELDRVLEDARSHLR